jgi:hypothetical protein
MPRPSIVIALTVFALSGSVAQAQIPSLRRKAKEAGRQAITGQQDPNRPPPRFDNTILELNPGVVARLIKGLEARSNARGRGGLNVGELRRRGAAASDEAATLNNQHSDDRARWIDISSAADNCVSEQLSHADERHQQEMHQRFAGMAGGNSADMAKFMQDYATVSQEMQQAVAANDSAAIRRAQVKLNRLMGVDAHADTVKARAACHVPAVPAWMRRADSLSALGDTLLVWARVAEDSARVSAAGVAGMTQAQFAMAAERAEAFVRLEERGSVGSGYVYTRVEEDALRARLVELKKYFG